MTEEQIKNFIDTELSYLNLNDKERDRYIKLLIKINNFIKYHRYTIDVFEYVEQKIEELYARFIEEGYSQEESILFTKKAGINLDRKDLTNNLDFLRAINLEKMALTQDVLFFRRRAEEAHAKKAYLVNENKKEDQTITNILRTTDSEFEKKFSVAMKDLKQKYPITEELKQVWKYQASLTDDKLLQELGLIREKLSYIYPTTFEELSVMKMIASMKEEEIKEKYGINRETLLQKHPLNKDTLNALRSIQLANNELIKKIFHKEKESVLQLRTITTDMITIANKNYICLKRGCYTKEELKELLKRKTKGTVQNG